jgi:hypothetical protein
MVWPSESNPSSVTVAQGPYDYEKSALRFSRRLNRTAAASFTAAFKESRGFYAQGADYDDFRVSGSFVWRPATNTELQYGFYQHKAKQGLLQFDRMVLPTTRSHNDLNHHWLKALHRSSESLLFELDFFRQHNYNRIYDDIYQYNGILKDNIIGASASIKLFVGRHAIKLAAGGKSHNLASTGADPTSTTLGALLTDSIKFGEDHILSLKGRIRNNNQTDIGIAASVLYQIKSWSAAVGALDYEPDIYAMYRSQPRFIFDDQSLISSYHYIADPDLKPKKILFVSSALSIFQYKRLTSKIELSFEKVYNDLTPVIEESESEWISSQENIDYDRITLTGNLGYKPIKYFSGRTGVTYFHYSPSDILPGIKFSPSLLAFSQGEFKIQNVLKDIDLSAIFQMKYYSKRYYAGLSSELLDRYEYEQAIVIDGSLVMRFGSFEFRITEDNILDYLVDNNYGVWGEYTMPPGMVWWQFTWNFID